MKNSYYLITLPQTKEQTRLTEYVSKGIAKAQNINARSIPHYRFSIDGTKVIVQGDVTEELKTYISNNKATIQYLGDNIDGFAEQKVIDYIQTNISEWDGEEIQKLVK